MTYLSRPSTVNTVEEKIVDHAVAHYMSNRYIAISGAMSAGDARQYLLGHLADNHIPPQIYIVDKDNYLKGLLSVRRLFIEKNVELPVASLMNRDFVAVAPDQDREQVAEMLGNHLSGPVPVLSHAKLIGELGEREIAALLRDEYTEDAQRQGASLPLDEPYLSTSPWRLWRKRISWLMLLFVAEAYTGTVLKAFSNELEAAIALAFFIPFLIGTGGNSGTQITSTLVRAMALGEVSLRNLPAVLRKEIPTSFLVAVSIGLVAWIRAWILDVGLQVTLVVCLTLIAITIWTAMVSSVIPLLLKRLHIDPAVVSAPFISTFIDGTGLIIYFEIAKLVMHDLS